ncbi:MAG TPA: hypothetical protein VM166_05005 [Gemmatimonadaceae bacterium]|nr:hypothetical protein [Gemmatimonadaceae bacterium]
MPSPTPTNSYDFSRFGLAEMTRCGIDLRRSGSGAKSMEEAASRVVRYLYEGLRDAGSDKPACALVRMFVTLPFDDLQSEQQSFAERVLGDRPDGTMKCLTLLATAGQEPDWNSRHTSKGHQALPLPSPEAVSRSPMIAQLIRQLGIEISALLSESGLVIDTAQHTFNVFYVGDAVGSPVIPGQKEFVIPYGVRSVLGFGGVMPSGELFATILFSKTPIPRDVADLFKTLALNVKVALLPFVGNRIFAQ